MTEKPQTEVFKKFPIYETSILTDVRRGTHTVTTYYSDGTSETRLVPLSPPILVAPLVV